MWNKIVAALQKPVWICVILAAITLQITLQRSGVPLDRNGHTHYNNFKIFKESYFHLTENKDLYALYPKVYFDPFKYTPTFALFMAPFAWLNDVAGLYLWNLLNALVLFFAIWKLPFRSDRTRLAAFAFIIIELITSLQNAQSNALIAGLIIFAFLFLEKKQTAWASLCIVLTIFIKLFGLAAFALFIFYPNKLRAVIYTIGWALLLMALPLLVVTPSQLLLQYESWANVLQSDHITSYGISVAGWLNSLGVHLDSLKNISVLLGAFLFLLPLIKFKFYNDLHFRLLFLSSILIWIVIFNHMAESPTFVIAVTGIAIWFFTQKQINRANTLLLILAFAFTVLASTDVYPRSVRDTIMVPYVIKVIPCILIWFKVVYELMFYQITERATDH